VLAALESTGGNVSEAARVLALQRNRLIRVMKLFEITTLDE
jgi:transcriptional regulator of acetoin/glycerol metabolism